MSKTIGLIGGMSWESTATYYSAINQLVRARRGGLASAELVMWSVDFESVVALQKAGDWDGAAARLADVAKRLAGAGAACVLICTNTMHLVADRVAAAIPVPLLNIIDVTGTALVAAGKRRPLLLATRYTMEHGFYTERMRAKCGLDPMVPDAADRGPVHDVIFDELCCGVVRDESRARFVEIIEKGRAAGADSVILGCTEIGLLISQKDSPLPIFDSTLLHAAAAVDFAEKAGAARAAE